MNPYLVLCVPRNSEDQRIRRAYLEGIKEATPESDPERFKVLSQAYEKIKDEPNRHAFDLFNRDCDGDSPLEVVLRHLETAARPAPLSFETMKEFLRARAKK